MWWWRESRRWVCESAPLPVTWEEWQEKLVSTWTGQRLYSLKGRELALCSGLGWREFPLSFILLSIGKGWKKPHFFLTYYLQRSYFPTDVTGNIFNCCNLQAWPEVNEKRIWYSRIPALCKQTNILVNPWEWKLGAMAWQANPSKIGFLLLFVLYLILLADWIFQAGWLHILYAICLKSIFSRKLGEGEEEERNNFSEAFSYRFCLSFKKICWLIN